MNTTTTAVKSSPRRRSLGRRLVVGGMTLAATAAIGLGVNSAPAGAAPHNPCATARAVFRAYMNEARFWIGAADRLADAGNTSGANQASAEADYYLGLASGALDGMSAAC